MFSHSSRPKLGKSIDADIFKDFYYLREELKSFCKENGLSVYGDKITLTDRVEHFLRTGQALKKNNGTFRSSIRQDVHELSLEAKIGENFYCTEKHREFFVSIIGKKFSFKVTFQKYLKSNPDKTYAEAIKEWYKIEQDGKNRQNKPIDPKFEYNKYVRDFFRDNKGKTLQDAIKCWKFKRNLPGSNNYDQKDLEALNQN